MNKQLLANRIITPDGTVLQSFNRYNFVSYTDTVVGEVYFVDGGLSYIRRSKNSVPAKDYSVYFGDKHDVVRGAFHWGTYGKDGNKQLKYVPLKDLTTEHISAILRSQKNITPELHEVFLDELEYRIDNKGVNYE